MNKEEKEEQIQIALKGKSITHVHYYLLNRTGYFYPDQPEQLVDAAVELTLDDGSQFSFGMNFKYVAIDAFSQNFESVIKEYNKDIPFLKVDVSNDSQWKKFIGNTISSTLLNCNWFEDLEEQIHFIPQDLEVVTKEKNYFAFCATAYSLDEEGISILGPDSEGEILVLFDEEDTKFFKRGKYAEPVIDEPHPEDFE
jgi:hypothetical protein